MGRRETLQPLRRRQLRRWQNGEAVVEAQMAAVDPTAEANEVLQLSKSPLFHADVLHLINLIQCLKNLKI